MRASVVAAVLLIAAGCYTESSAPRPALTSFVLRGRVVAPDGTWADGAIVELSDLDEATKAWTPGDHVRSGFNGTWWLRAERPGKHRLTARRDDAIEASVEF